MEIPICELACLSRFNDFEVILNGKSYYFPSTLLSAISPVVKQLVSENKFSLELPSIDGSISYFFNIVTGVEVEINRENALFLFAIAVSIQNDELLEAARNVLLINHDEVEVIKLISALNERGIVTKDLVNIIAINFDSFIQVEKFQELAPNIVYDIIMTDSLICNDNSSLFKYIIKRFPENPEIFTKLMKFACIHFLDPITLQLLVSAKSIDMNQYKEALIPIILSGVGQGALNTSNNNVLLSYSKGNEMNGLINYIRNNSVLSNCIELKASSEFNEEYSVQNLLSTDSSKYFSSSKGPIEDITIHLKSGELALTQYTLMSCESGRNSICPISWIISGSNDGNTWSLIDSHTEDKSLCASNKAVTFSAKKGVWTPYSYFKIAQIESGGHKNNKFIIAGFDLFGVYTPSI